MANGGNQVKETIFAWEGKDKSGKTVRGELRAGGEAVVNVTLRRQGGRRRHPARQPRLSAACAI